MPTSLLMLEPPTDAAEVRAALAASPYRIVAELTDCARLETEVARVSPDVIVACTASPTNAMLDGLRIVSASSPHPIVMFATDPRREVIRKAVDAGVSAYVVDGWAPERIAAIIEAACARFEAFASVKKELDTTRLKLAERKVVEKAKGLVMQQRGLSEEHAYSALRKMAMDQNLTIAEVARRVISVSQLLA